MKIIGQEILQSLYQPSPESHKGDNGRVLVIAGSDKYHGALLLAIQAVSRVVDMVYVHSVAKNLAILDRLKGDTAVFISVSDEELWQTVGLVDIVLIGPGLDESDKTIALTKRLLIEYPEKKVVVDATALWHADPVWLRKNVIVTPHARQFAPVFKIPLVASTSTKSPSLKTRVATCRPTTHGFFISRETTAACESMPPLSVIIAAAFFISGT